MNKNTDKNGNTPLPGTANDAPKDPGAKPVAAPTETTPAEKPQMDEGSKPDTTEPTRNKA